MNTSDIAVKNGDEVELVLRARVFAVQAIEGGTILYFHKVDGDQRCGYVAPVYLGDKSAVQSVTIIRPKLNLDDLPIGTVLEGLDSGETAGIYRLVQRGDELVAWAALDGSGYTSAELTKRHDELIELVRKGATP